MAPSENWSWRVGALHPTAAALTVTIVLLALAGCQTNILLEQPQLAPAPPVATVAPSAHALALIGVEFDPPLEYRQIVSQGSVTLLVAVENQGTAAESDARLVARLLDPNTPGADGELLYERLTLKNLAPGEVRVARFAPVSDLPLLRKYTLIVELAPAAGELNLTDNQRSYDILIQTAD